MSYILDALDKSTAEGNPEVALSLLRNAERDRKRSMIGGLIGGLIVLALLANVVIFSWLFWPDRNVSTGQVRIPETPATTISVAEPTRNTVNEPSEHISAGSPITPSTTDLTPPRTSNADPGGAHLQAAPVVRRPITYADLPEPARRTFPRLEFSTHVYASDSTLRAVVANGQRLTEGDRIEGLELVEITEEGVIFGYQTYLVRISILAVWED